MPPAGTQNMGMTGGRSRRLQDHGEQAQPGLESGVGVMLPGPGSDPPGLAAAPEAATTALPEPACTTVPVSARQLSRRRAGRTGPGSFSAGGDSPVSTGSSHSRSAVPGERVSLSVALIASALAVTTVRG
jgi:hypothetical protein